MAEKDLWAVIGRSRVDPNFGMQALHDFEGTIKDEGFTLDEEEMKTAKKNLGMSGTSPAAVISPDFPASPDLLQFQQEMMKKRFAAQVNRMNDLGEYTVQILKNTLDNAARAYDKITLMNTVMFYTGIALFIFAAGYGAFSREIIFSLVFGGLGTASFIAFFLLGPVEKTQVALSNLVQVEVAFMTFFEQLSFWENYALAPQGNPPAPDPAKIEKASAALQERTAEIIALLQQFVEKDAVPKRLIKQKTAAGKSALPTDS